MKKEKRINLFYKATTANDVFAIEKLGKYCEDNGLEFKKEMFNKFIDIKNINYKQINEITKYVKQLIKGENNDNKTN